MHLCLRRKTGPQDNRNAYYANMLNLINTQTVLYDSTVFSIKL